MRRPTIRQFGGTACQGRVRPAWTTLQVPHSNARVPVHVPTQQLKVWSGCDRPPGIGKAGGASMHAPRPSECAPRPPRRLGRRSLSARTEKGPPRPGPIGRRWRGPRAPAQTRSRESHEGVVGTLGGGEPQRGTWPSESSRPSEEEVQTTTTLSGALASSSDPGSVTKPVGSPSPTRRW